MIVAIVNYIQTVMFSIQYICYGNTGICLYNLHIPVNRTDPCITDKSTHALQSFNHVTVYIGGT